MNDCNYTVCVVVKDLKNDSQQDVSTEIKVNNFPGTLRITHREDSFHYYFYLVFN